jgi:hypothetical protein
VKLEPENEESLRLEYEQNLKRGRAFIPSASGLAERELCQIVVVHPRTKEELAIPAEAVYVQEPAGVGFALSMSSEFLAELERWVGAPADEAAEPAPSTTDANVAPAEREEQAQRTIYEKVRKLSARERDVMARQGMLPERVALERCFGGAVWEVLLQNPQITTSELARIAKNPGLTGTIIAAIAGNAGWVGKPEVARALIANPKVTGIHLERALRALPRAELNALAVQTGVRQQVRAAAKNLLK